MNRREVLPLLVGALAACRGGPAARPEAPTAPPLRLEPLVALVPAAGLVWLVDLQLHDLVTSPVLAPAVSLLVPAERFDAFAARHGGVDLRAVSRLVLAGYPDATTLALARTPVRAASIEAAFAARAVVVEGHAVEGGITRFWGSVGHDREQVALFGADAVGLERGRLGPLRAALYFAQGKLKKALPALAADPLARPAALLGEAPARAFAPGPFVGECAAGLGGLLRATTAVAGAALPVAGASAGSAGSARKEGALELRVLLMGAWGTDASAAAERLGAAFQLLAHDPLGRLMALDHPLEEPRVSGDAEALRLSVRVDPRALARGLHDATEAGIAEIMAY
jgi:hypothetical protein